MSRFDLIFTRILLSGIVGLPLNFVRDACGDDAKPFPGSYEIRGEFDDKDDHENLSGIAMLGEGNGLVAPDEGKRVYPFTIDHESGTIRLGKDIKLTDAKGEIDIEGIAAADSAYFIVGSHGVSRKSQAFKPSAFSIWKLDIDEKAGVPTKDSEIRRGTLADFIATDPELGPFYRVPLQEYGVNIEGLAYSQSKDRLYAGFRAPSREGHAFVLEISPGVVFGAEEKMTHVLHRLDLGAGYGIRDLAKVNDGFLVLAGNAPPEENPDHDPERPFVLYFWSGAGSQVTRLTDVPRPDPEAKPEAILVLRETADAYDVLILSDKAKNGAPIVLHIER